MTVGQALAVAVGGKEGRSQTFALGPDDTAYRRIDDDGIASVVMAANWRTPVWPVDRYLAPTPKGSISSPPGKMAPCFMLHSSIWRIRRPSRFGTLWANLSIPEYSRCAAPSGSAHVFGLDRSGAVRHLKIPATSAKREAWDTLDGKFAGSLSVVAQKDAFHVLVSDPERGIFHKLWPPKHGDRSKTEWIQLAGFKGPASATLAKDGSLVVVGFEHGNPSAFKVRTASRGWGAAGWSKIRIQEAARPARSRKTA